MPKETDTETQGKSAVAAAAAGSERQDEILRDLNQRFDYCDDQMVEVSNFMVRGNFAEAAAEMEKMIHSANQCLHDMRLLAQNNQSQP